MGDVKQRREKSGGHEESVDGQGQRQAKIFSEDEFPSSHRAGKHRVKRLLLDLFGDQTDADENSDHHPEDGDGRQPEIHQDNALESDGYLAKERSTTDKQQRKENEIVEDAIADGFAKSVVSDMADAVGNHCEAAPVFTSGGEAMC